MLLNAEKLIEKFVGTHRSLVLGDRPEWAQALLDDRDRYLPPGESPAFLKQRPIQTLALVGNPFLIANQWGEREKLVAFLYKVGLRTVGDFIRLPTSHIHRRFGKMGETLHDWACGRRTLCLPLFHPEENIQEHIDADDLHSLEALLFRLRQTLIRMQARLQGRAQVAKRFQLRFHLESHPSVVKTVELTEATRDAQAILRILHEYLNSLHWESPLVRLEIEIVDTQAHIPGQLSLFDDSESRLYDLAHYVARLRARVGEERVGFACLKSSHLPERSFALSWPPPAPISKREEFPQRPLFLFTPPKPFQPSVQWELSLSENLFVEWWDPGGCRQYFIARKQEQCLWVYRDSMKGEWFAHGTFD